LGRLNFSKKYKNLMSKIFCLSLLSLCLFLIQGMTESTPFSDPLVEETETSITCELTTAPRYRDIPVFDSAKDANAALGTYHYKLWLPAGYLSDPKKSWPCLFIMSPGGNANRGNMTSYLKSSGVIGVMLVEAKNGSWSPIMGNFLAAHDDVIQRVRVAEGQKFATGYSGGARASSVFVQIRPGFGGLILQGAGAAFGSDKSYHVSGLQKSSDPFTVMLMGDKDKNFNESDKMGAVLPSTKFKAFTFEGGHVWAPADIFDEGMAWLQKKVSR
jgi:hypothetical protein